MALPIILGMWVIFTTIIIPIIIKILLAFGVGFVTFTGITALLDGVLAEIQVQFASQGFTAVSNLLAYMNVDNAITMIFSAIVMRATLRGLQLGGDLRKFGFAT